MANTITHALSERLLADDGKDTVPYLNRELIPVVRQARAALNADQLVTVSGDTAGSPSAWKTVWEAPEISPNVAGLVEAKAVYLDSAGFTAGYGRVYGYASDSAGTVAQTGAVSIYSYETAAAFDFRVTLVGNALLAQVFDAGATTNYRVVIRVMEVAL